MNIEICKECLNSKEADIIIEKDFNYHVNNKRFVAILNNEGACKCWFSVISKKNIKFENIKPDDWTNQCLNSSCKCYEAQLIDYLNKNKGV